MGFVQNTGVEQTDGTGRMLHLRISRSGGFDFWLDRFLPRLVLP